jgi:hypothetical protein
MLFSAVGTTDLTKTFSLLILKWDSEHQIFVEEAEKEK